MACPALAPGASFVGGMLRFVDCQMQSIGSDAYQALTAPDGYFGLILTAMLTVFVALFGYRMLFGHSPSVRDGVLALVKIGIVLVFTSSWPAYRTVVYDVAVRGPAELAATIGAPAGVPGTSGDMVSRLAFVDDALVQLAIAGTGQAEAKPPRPGEPIAEMRPPPPFGGFDAFAFGTARILFLISAIGSFAIVWLVAGLMLAVAPFFVAFLLFDATRGLFEGWLRVLAGAAFGALGTAIVLGVELALIEPWLIAQLNARAAGDAIPDVPVELVVISLLFCIVLATMLYATARVAIGFQLAPLWQAASAHLPWPGQRDATIPPARAGNTRTGDEGRSRAAAIVDAVAASQRREAASIPAMASAQSVSAGAPSRGIGGQTADTPLVAVQPLGQSYRRRTSIRVSPLARQRDRMS